MVHKKVIAQTIDEIDIILMKRLLRNSRTSFSEIAKECKMSTLAIKNRYNRLEKIGVIKGSTVIATEEGLHGVEGIVDSGIMVETQRINQFFKYVEMHFQNKNHWCLPIKFNPKYNVSVTVLARSIRELQEIKDTLTQHSDVVRAGITIWTAIRNIPQNLDLKPI